MDERALTASVHLHRGHAAVVKDYSRTVEPFVVVDLADGALSLFVSDLAVINRLAEAISEARKLLVAAQGEDPPPIIRPAVNPYLTLGSLPTGVA